MDNISNTCFLPTRMIEGYKDYFIIKTFENQTMIGTKEIKTVVHNVSPVVVEIRTKCF